MTAEPNTTPDEIPDFEELFETLRMHTHPRTRAGGGGTWVRGRIAGHRFEALVFPEHATCPSFELQDSRISKLWVQRVVDRITVANFDRGWDVRPTNTLAGAIVDLLATVLADMTYHD